MSFAGSLRACRSRAKAAMSKTPAASACAAARKAEADARDVKIVCGWLIDAVVERAEVNAALDIKDVAHAPRYGHDDVARALIEQGGEVDRPDDVRAAKIEAISRVADTLESDWDSFL